METSSTLFKAQIEDINGHLVLRLPQSVSAGLPSRGQVMLVVTTNGSSFTVPAEPDGRGGHWIGVSKGLKVVTDAVPGQVIDLNLKPTKDWPEPDVPADIMAAIESDATAVMLWHDITPMARWEWIRWINNTKVAATRAKRIAVMASKFSAGKRRPCCFNRSESCVPEVSQGGKLIEL